MKDLNKYKLEDFVQDIHFRKWVMGKNQPENAVLEDWLSANPEKTTLIEEAKTLVIATQIEEITVNHNYIKDGIAQILETTKTTKSWFNVRLSIGIAATVTLVLSSIWLYNKQDSPKAMSPTDFVSHNETENKGSKPLTMTLSDGTQLTLKKDSKIQVASDFGHQTRTVFLIGEAFFNVKKDTEHPFLVIAGGVVTKVLGTSFNVRAYNNETQTSVAVRTGHVTVYQQEKPNQKQNNHPEQILLTPNQQVVFEKENGKLVKTLVEKPVILIQKAESFRFEYNETPIVTVLSQLESAYGVKMVYDADLLAQCNLTASFGEEPLFDKIEIICETIQARYEIADGQIVIYAKGCK